MVEQSALLESTEVDSVTLEYRPSPYEFVETAETTSQVFVCGDSIMLPTSDPLRETEIALIPRSE